MNKFAWLICFFLLSGCATGHQPYSYFGGGGYRDIQLSENSFKVTVEANGYTSPSRAADLALLRSAELSLQNGFKYFVISGTSDDSYSALYTAPATTNVTTSTYGDTSYSSAQTYGGQTSIITFPTPSMTIVCFKDKPELQAVIYDAELLSKSLRSQLGIK